MADNDLPVPQNYYVFTSESLDTDEPVGVTFDGDVVHATPRAKTVWTLKYLDREKGLCTFIHTECGSHAGIPENEDGSPSYARRLDEPQHWMLKKVDRGISISRVVNGVELFTYLDDDGQIKASPSSERVTSWVFQPVEG